MTGFIAPEKIVRIGETVLAPPVREGIWSVEVTNDFFKKLFIYLDFAIYKKIHYKTINRH